MSTTIPAGYKSAAARRLRRDLRNAMPPRDALEVARIVARQGGDHVALAVIDAALDRLPSLRNLAEAEREAHGVASALGAPR